MVTREKPKTKRQLVEEARRASLDGRWDEAVELNRLLIERFPRDAEAHNRLGRIYTERGKAAEAVEEYSAALRIDPANMIARRNLQRHDLLRQKGIAVEDGGTPIPRTAVFIEEVGKTWVDELVNPIATERLAAITSGVQLQIAIQDDRLVVSTLKGERLGEIEAKTAERVIALMTGGNRYEVYALGTSNQSLRVILREVYRDPAHAGKVSFPRQIKATRAYIRERDALRLRDESDFLLSDEDEDDDDTTADNADDPDATAPDADPYIEDTVTVPEEEEPQI
ncbi:MAG: hypothetical protein AVDCRST_MAG73-2534 [uncultured Thermomicrobiales bacterium]|uniref:Uncharacterized protein n=1 Tax=uncultured Thermomicrobiales bacterium TaxID=1645740 RepID=A0A6J4UHM7_9BACT|nr:MAG: hypothetical protein AVDCRST_MAG73-2534 [uncultured Thermomicrobiales bacterium]